MTEECKRLYVSNLNYSVTPLQLKELFNKAGPVLFYKIVVEKSLGRSRGFGFVEMENLADAKRAIKELHGTKYAGRTISVDYAHPPP